MRKYCLAALMIASTCVAGLGMAAQEPKPARQDEKISIRTAEVVLDAIVKDKKGRPVKDLSVNDVQVFEDGVRQKIESFQLISRKLVEKAVETEKPGDKNQIILATPGGDDGGGDTGSNISAIALVFDRLSGDARKRARDAAMIYIGEEARPDDYIGVFSIDLSMRIQQNYTTKLELIKQGIEKAAASASSSFTSNTEQTRALAARSEELQVNINQNLSAAAAGGPAAGAAGAAAAASDVDQKFVEMQRRMLETFEILERDQQGYATTNGLLSVVNSMARLPGRKAVIFFSEGLALPPNVVAHFRSVINQANRANVSVYTVDAAGLRTISTLQESRDEINALGRRRIEEAFSSTPILGTAMTQRLERNEDLIRLNPQGGLTQLALETGGTFIGDTNDIGPRLRQVDEDLHSYYLLTYIPVNQDYDGKFREISLKLNRSGLDVQARKGYYAVNATGSSPVLFYEAPALALLSSNKPANAIPMRAAGISFPEAERPGRMILEIQAPAGSFTFFDDKDKKSFSTNFIFLALVKDSSKQVVTKFSQQYILTGTSDQLKNTKNGAILFYRETDLPPGRYEIESVVYDSPTEKASRQSSFIDIPANDSSRVRLSSVSIIQRAEQIKEQIESPFKIGGLLIYPNLGEPIKKSETNKVGFYFVLYRAADNNVTPRVSLEILQKEKQIVQTFLKLSEADATGRIPYAGALPINSLAPDTYELRISAADAKGTINRSVFFTVVP